MYSIRKTHMKKDTNKNSALFSFQVQLHYLKLQSITFLVKNDLKSIFEQVHNQPVFKTIALL